MGSFLDSINLAYLIASAVKIVFFSFLVILPMVAYSVYFERRGSAVIQDRVARTARVFRSLFSAGRRTFLLPA